MTASKTLSKLRSRVLKETGTTLESFRDRIESQPTWPPLDRLYDLVRTQVGHVDIVFANAGVATLSPLGSLSEADVDQMLNINIKGVIWTVQKALPLMRSGGSIILNASIAASTGFPNWSVYSATKAAVRSFARTWSSDLKGRGIRVNAIWRAAWSVRYAPKRTSRLGHVGAVGIGASQPMDTGRSIIIVSPAGSAGFHMLYTQKVEV